MNRGMPIGGRKQPETSGTAHRANLATTTAGVDHRGVAVGIGRELSYARLDLKWTRATAASRAGISVSTLDNSETGVRRCSPLTLIKRCWSMAIPPPDLLELAMQRRLINPDKISLLVDLHAVASDPTPPHPVRNWAAAHLEHDQHRHGAIRLPPPAVAEIARVLEVKLATLIGYLARRAPYSVRGSASHPSRTVPDPQPLDVALTTEVLAHAVGIVLRDLRIERGWTPHEVVERLPALSHVRTWYSYERGEVMSSIAQLIEFGQLFSTPAPILLGRTLRRLGLGTPDAAFISGLAEAHDWTDALAERSPSHARAEVEP